MTGQQTQGTYQALDALAEIGAIILLFEIGLHTDLYELCKVGKSALWVGSAGVVLPFFGGWVASKYILHLQGLTPLIMGAALTATSVGITARVFQDLKLLHTAESQVVLGAAVADDVIGLVILAVISAFGQSQTTNGTQENLIWMAAKVTFFAVAFLVLAVWIGVKCVPFFEKIIGRMKSRGVLTVLSLAFCILVALLGQQVKLALIIGAFVAGLVLSHCLSGENIPLLGRVVAVADAFSAMTTTRPYRRSMSWHDALAEVEKHRGTQFDPELADVFLRIARKRLAEKHLSEQSTERTSRISLKPDFALETTNPKYKR